MWYRKHNILLLAQFCLSMLCPAAGLESLLKLNNSAVTLPAMPSAGSDIESAHWKMTVRTMGRNGFTNVNGTVYGYFNPMVPILVPWNEAINLVDRRPIRSVNILVEAPNSGPLVTRVAAAAKTGLEVGGVKRRSVAEELGLVWSDPTKRTLEYGTLSLSPWQQPREILINTSIRQPLTLR